MTKKNTIIGAIVVIVALLLFSNRTNNVDWFPSYAHEGKRPLDTKVFFEQLPYWFKNQKISTLYTTFYEYEQEHISEKYSKSEPQNYICITGNYSIDKPSFESLLNFIGNGNNALIVAHTFPNFVKDSLKFELDYNEVKLKEAKKAAYLTHLNDSLYYTQKHPYGEAFITDSTNVAPLGYSFSEFCESKTNFISIPYKKGVFYIHTIPELFTNYQILAAEQSFYIDNVVSFLPEHPVLFEKMIKIDPDLDKGSLSFILSKPSLKWAFYLALLSILLFMLFNAKRRQRIIPKIEPLKNTTTAFVQTVSTLHLEAEDYNGIIQKNIIFFLEHIRAKYHLPTDNLNAEFIKKLSQKSGKPFNDVERLVTLILKMKAHTFSTPDPLKKLHAELEKFYRKP